MIDVEATHHSLKGNAFRPIKITGRDEMPDGWYLLTKKRGIFHPWMFLTNGGNSYMYESKEKCMEDVKKLKEWSKRI